MTTDDADDSGKIELAAIEWCLRLRSRVPSNEEAQSFERWLKEDDRHAEAYDRALTTHAAFDVLSRENISPKLFKRSWMFKTRRAFRRFRSSFKGSRLGVAATLATMLVCLSVFGLGSLNGSVDPIVESEPIIEVFVSGIGETKEVTLQDGSIITLGARSKVEVALTPSERRVDLVNGAAVFDVASEQNRPFFVSTEKFTARVMGTIFDVRSNGGIVRLSVLEGAVEASHPLMLDSNPTSVTSSAIVSAGEQIVATRSKGLSGVGHFDVEQFASWRRDRMRYIGATLEELIADANRYSDKEIRLDAAIPRSDAGKVTLTFNGDDVDRLLAILPEMFDVEVHDEGDRFIEIRKRVED